uniref:(California timema) hypothetical protein n=1 Tax=Timema californicum TaxID=61474 RepID=A0A7R9JEE2_TIMCA|nr:unnamed protein product [Timema californicum]
MRATITDASSMGSQFGRRLTDSGGRVRSSLPLNSSGHYRDLGGLCEVVRETATISLAILGSLTTGYGEIILAFLTGSPWREVKGRAWPSDVTAELSRCAVTACDLQVQKLGIFSQVSESGILGCCYEYTSDVGLYSIVLYTIYNESSQTGAYPSSGPHQSSCRLTKGFGGRGQGHRAAWTFSYKVNETTYGNKHYVIEEAVANTNRIISVNIL